MFEKSINLQNAKLSNQNNKNAINSSFLLFSRKKTKVIKLLTKKGLYSKAFKNVTNSFENLKIKYKKKPYKFLSKALKNISPSISLYTKRKRYANKQLPIILLPKKGYNIGIKWLILGANKNAGFSFNQQLSTEIFNASLGNGNAALQKITSLRTVNSIRYNIKSKKKQSYIKTHSFTKNNNIEKKFKVMSTKLKKII